MEDNSPFPYLQSHINGTLRVTTTDNRFFIGELKCTDRVRSFLPPHPPRPPTPPPPPRPTSALKHQLTTPQDRNLILHMTNEFRTPTAPTTTSASPSTVSGSSSSTAELKSRYIGLVVIPGHVIVKIEREVEGDRDGRRRLAALGIGRGGWC